MPASANRLFTLLGKGHLEKLGALLTETNIHVKSTWGCSLLHEALARDAGVEAVRLLLSRGIDVNLLDDEGNSALHYATSAGNYEIAKLLLEAGADPNLRGSRGMTALRWAITTGDFRLVQECLDHGGDPWIENDVGSSTIDYAEAAWPDRVPYLKQFGSKRQQQRGSRLFGEVSAKLLEIGGTSVQEGNPDDELARLLERGQIFSPESVVVRRERVGECHHNVAKKYCQAKYRKAEIVTGYALSHGIWYLHSWLLLKGQIVETTLPCDSYFGYRLNFGEARAFVKSTRPDLVKLLQGR